MQNYNELYILGLFIASLISILVACFAILRYKMRGAMMFALMNMAAAEWAFARALEALVIQPEAKIFCGKMEYLGIVALAPCYLIFALQYTQQDKLLKTRNVVGLFVPSVIMFVLVLSNEFHRLVWPTIVPAASDSHLIYSHGVAYWLFFIYFLLLVVVSTAVIIWSAVNYAPDYKGQVTGMVTGSTMPWIGYLLYITGVTNGMDVTPLFFSISGIIFAVTFFRANLFSISPVARNLLVDNMPECMLVIDTNNRIADINLAARRLLEIDHVDNVIGRDITNILSNYPDLVDRYQNVIEVKEEISIPLPDDSIGYFLLEIMPLLGDKGQVTGRLIILNDISEEKRARDEIQHLLDIEHKRALEMEALRSSVAAVSSSLTFDDILGQILMNVGKVVPHKTASIMLIEKDSIRLAKHKGYELIGHPLQDEIFPLDLFPILIKMQQDAQPIIIPDTDANTAWTRIPETEWIRSYAGVPITVEKKVIGFLNLESDVPFAFIPEQTEKLSVFADQIAISLHNASLYETAQNELAGRKLTEEKLRLQGAALDAAANAVVITDTNGNIIWVNPAFTRITGYAAGEVIGKTPSILKSGKHEDDFYKTIWATVKAGNIWYGEIINRRKDGLLYTEEQTIAPVHNEEGEVTHFIAIKQDVTSRKQAEEELMKRSEEIERARKLAEQLQLSAESVSISLDLNVVLPAILDQMKIVFGYDTATIQLLEGDSMRVISARGLPESEINRVRLLQEYSYNLHLVTDPDPIIVNVSDENIGWKPVESMPQIRSNLGVPLLMHGNVIGALVMDSFTQNFFSEKDIPVAMAFARQAAVAITNADLFEKAREEIQSRIKAEDSLRSANETLINQIKEINALKEKLSDQAIRDPLTGLFNRRYLEETLTREIAHAERHSISIGVMVMDIDHFKLVNDTYGHTAGDRFLKAFADMITAKIRTSDVVCRYGGEEFVIVMPGANTKIAYQRAEELRQDFQNISILSEENLVKTTISIGVSAYPELGKDGEQILINADKALYHAKQHGRNQVVVFQQNSVTLG